MSWQFYKEVYPSSGTPLIEDVITANWGSGGVPAAQNSPAPTREPVTRAPTVPTPATPTGNIEIVNYGSSTQWYYAANVQGVAPGFAITKFEILKDNAQWFTCPRGGAAYQCSLDTMVSVPLSIRLTATKNGVSSDIIGFDAVTAFTNNLVSDFGSNFGGNSNPVPSPTSSPTTSMPTTSSGGGSDDGGRITIENRPGGGPWWYMVYLRNVPSNVAIATVEMRDQNMAEWETGVHSAQEDYYLFSDNANVPYQPPLSFRVTTSSGKVVTQMDAMGSTSDGDSFTMDESVIGGVDPFSMGDSPKNPMSWSDWVAVVTFVCVGAGLIYGAWYCYKRRIRGKGFISDANNISMELSKKDEIKNQYTLSPNHQNQKEVDAMSPQKVGV